MMTRSAYENPPRLIPTGIRKEWIGKNFVVYVLMLGGEFRKVKFFGDSVGVGLLWVPENEWPHLREEYLAYESATDKWWRPLGNVIWSLRDGCVEAYVA